MHTVITSIVMPSISLQGNRHNALHCSSTPTKPVLQPCQLCCLCYMAVPANHVSLASCTHIFATYPVFAQCDAGDRVAILSPNNVEWITTMYATAMMGAILVPLNPSYTSAELQHALQHCKPNMLIAASSSKGIDLTSRVHAATGYKAASGQRPPLHFLSHVLFPDAPEAGRSARTGLQIVYMKSHTIHSVRFAL